MEERLTGAMPFSVVGEQLVRLASGFAADRGRELPPWNRVVVGVEENGVRSDEWTAADDFEPRWRQLVARVARDWINLTVDRVVDGELRLVVEFLSRPRVDGSRFTYQPHQVAVNLSGPSFAWLDSLPATP